MATVAPVQDVKPSGEQPIKMKDGFKDFSSQWPYPKESDGWYRAHNAMRADLEAIAGMNKKFQAQLAGGTPLSPAQLSAAKAFAHAHLHFLKHHHHNEEEIAIKYMNTRVEAPAQISEDHRSLEVTMNDFGKAIDRLADASGLDAQSAAHAQFAELSDKLTATLKEHFEEEQELAMPLARAYFSKKEWEKNVNSKIVRSLDATETGVFFRNMSRDERKAFARQEGIPFFIKWILWSRVSKYERRIWHPFQQECLGISPAA